jgi:hypothetical protein
MEGLLGADLSGVRVHVGPEAASIGALAFTVGSDLYFAPGQYNPGSPQGQRLLGHELTHVVQQRAGRVRNPFGSGLAVVQDAALEAEADRMGMRAVSTSVSIQAKPVGARPSLATIGATSSLVQSKKVPGTLASPQYIVPGTFFWLRPLPQLPVNASNPSHDVPHRIVQQMKRTAAAPLKRPPSSRKKVKVDPLSVLPTHFDGPHYRIDANWHSHAGGSHSSAILGPNSLRGMGTDAKSNLPKAIGKARKVYPLDFFKAGHLLNADFYGDGKDSKNLTILNAVANTRMQSFDNRIKEAVQGLAALYTTLAREVKIDISPIRFGVFIDVKVASEKWGDNYPDNCIAKKLSCSASIYRKQDVDNIIAGIADPGLAAKVMSQRDYVIARVAAANLIGIIKNEKIS